MGAQASQSLDRTPISQRIITRIGEDIGSGNEDEMIDMQARIGSMGQLKRRMTTESPFEKHRPPQDELFGDLFGDQVYYSTRSHSTQESLSGMSNE